MHLLPLLSLLFLSTSLYAQTLTPNFTGSLTFEDYYPNQRFAGDSCGEAIGQETWFIRNGEITISTIEPLDTEANTYLPIRFFKNGDTIFISHITCSRNPSENNKRVEFEQFRISNDTISSLEYYRIDSFDGLNFDNGTFYLGDTVLTILGETYECYLFEKASYWRRTYGGPSHCRRVFFVEKKSLFPIQEVEFVTYTNNSYICHPTNVWILVRELRLVAWNKEEE